MLEHFLIKYNSNAKSLEHMVTGFSRNVIYYKNLDKVQ